MLLFSGKQGSRRQQTATCNMVLMLHSTLPKAACSRHLRPTIQSNSPQQAGQPSPRQSGSSHGPDTQADKTPTVRPIRLQPRPRPGTRRLQATRRRRRATPRKWRRPERTLRRQQQLSSKPTSPRRPTPPATPGARRRTQGAAAMLVAAMLAGATPAPAIRPRAPRRRVRARPCCKGASYADVAAAI